MKSEWQTVPMGELCSIESGASDTKDAVSDGPYAFFDRSKKIKRSTRFLYDCEALIIPGEGAEFFPKQYSGKFDLHQRAYALFDFRPELDIRFLFHYLHHRADYFPSVAVGATVKSLRRRHFLELPVPVPPLPEQKRIVGILDEAFAAIATAKANTEKNLANARAVFESHLQVVFTQRGEGWVSKRIGDVGETQYGLSESMNRAGKGYKIFRMGEVQGGRLIDTGEMKYADISRTEFEKYRLHPGDVLFNRTNSFELVGKTGIFALEGDYCFASYLVRINLNGHVVDPYFLNYFMNSEQFQKSIKTKASKSINQANINATILANETIAFPASLREQRSIVKRLDTLQEETQRLESLCRQKLAALDALKKSLLHQAFTGQLTASAAERLLSGATA